MGAEHGSTTRRNSDKHNQASKASKASIKPMNRVEALHPEDGEVVEAEAKDVAVGEEKHRLPKPRVGSVAVGPTVRPFVELPHHVLFKAWMHWRAKMG